jgi:hypothetical protein
VIYVELSKLKEILKKPVNDMTDLEKRAVFFRYADDPAYRERVNKIIESKEELQMAGELMSISQDERERAIFLIYSRLHNLSSPIFEIFLKFDILK